MTKRNAFVVLQPMNHLFQVIEAAHRRGLVIFVMHAGAFAPLEHDLEAAKLIHKVIPVADWSDTSDLFDALAREVRLDNIRGTYAGVEITLPFDVALRLRLGLPSWHPDVLKLCTNKYILRQELRRAGLSRLQSYPADQLMREGRWPFAAGAYLKPVQGGGSVAVRRCNGLDDLRAALVEVEAVVAAAPDLLRAQIAAGGGMFVEEEARGELVSVEAMTMAGRTRILGITSRLLLETNLVIEMGQGFPYYPKNAQEIEDAVIRALHHVGVTFGATHTEVIITADGAHEIVEINPRLIGADGLTMINLSYGFRLEDALATLGVGENPIPALDGALPTRHAYLRQLMLPDGEEKLEAIDMPVAEVPHFRVTKPMGFYVGKAREQHHRVANFVTCAATQIEARRNMEAVLTAIRINRRPIADDRWNQVVGP